MIHIIFKRFLPKKKKKQHLDNLTIFFSSLFKRPPQKNKKKQKQHLRDNVNKMSPVRDLKDGPKSLQPLDLDHPMGLAARGEWSALQRHCWLQRTPVTCWETTKDKGVFIDLRNDIHMIFGKQKQINGDQCPCRKIKLKVWEQQQNWTLLDTVFFPIQGEALH